MRILKILLSVLILLAGGLVAAVYLVPEPVTRLLIEAERGRAGLARRQIELPGGVGYAYLEGGNMAGEPLLLLHGFGANKDNFSRVARFLTPQYHVIVPDHIGFGESAHPAEADYSPAAQAERLHALLQALGIRRVHIGGNSMGGQIALAYAARYPAETASLWLLDPAGVWSAPASELRDIVTQTERNPLIARNEEEFAQILPFVMSDPPFIPRPMLDVMAQERIRNVALEERIFRQIADDSIEARVNGLPVPALIVWGDRDRALHVGSAAILHKLLPQSRVVIMPGIGHLPMIERPQQSADDYRRFREELAAAAR